MYTEMENILKAAIIFALGCKMVEAVLSCVIK